MWELNCWYSFLNSVNMIIFLCAVQWKNILINHLYFNIFNINIFLVFFNIYVRITFHHFHLQAKNKNKKQIYLAFSPWFSLNERAKMTKDPNIHSSQEKGLKILLRGGNYSQRRPSIISVQASFYPQLRSVGFKPPLD
jgi:hypothetical protein